MKYLILDIESAPLEIKDNEIINYLMDKKISKEMRSLDPNYSKVICIAVKLQGETTKLFFGYNEKQILEDFWNFINQTEINTIFVTHNGYNFDIPFLILRSVINKIEIPRKINTNKWGMENSNHFDTMQFFSFYGNFINPNLNILAKLNGILIPEERFSGYEIEKFYLEKNWDKIKEHCKQDVELLEKLFDKICLDYLKLKKRL